MNSVELREIVRSQNERKAPANLIKRDIFPELEAQLKNNFVIIITGIRRAGKSVLLGQMKKKHPGYYLDFDDERLIDFTVKDFELLYEIFIELFGKKNIFYFDEIQNVSGWERFVRRLQDEGKKVFVTGSNASMLSKELGTHLTGRHLNMALFPFSFNEFLKFKKFEVKDVYITHEKAELKKNFETYLMSGGFPAYLQTENTEYLKTLFDNILYRDIIVRYKIPNEKPLKELVSFAASNTAREVSFNSIRKMLNFGSATTVKEYFHYLENSLFSFIVPKFEYSVKKQIYAKKKLYFADNSIPQYFGFNMSKNLGRLLENMVFSELKRQKSEIYFFSEKNECDFLIKEKEKITQAIQVCYNLNDENKEREINGLMEALKKFNLKTGLILTYDQEDKFKIDKKEIKVVPVWKWMLN